MGSWPHASPPSSWHEPIGLSMTCLCVWRTTRLGRLAEIRSTRGGLYAGSNSSKMSSHLRPRANSEATNHKSADHASRTIVWHLCLKVCFPFANANLSEVDPET